MTPREPDHQKIFDLLDRETIGNLTEMIPGFLFSFFIKKCRYKPDVEIIDDMTQSVWLRLLNAIQKGYVSDQSIINKYTCVICMNIINDYINEEISIKGVSSKQRLTFNEKKMLLKGGINPDYVLPRIQPRLSKSGIVPDIDSLPDSGTMPGEESGSEVSQKIREAIIEGIQFLTPAKRQIAEMYYIKKRTESQTAVELSKSQSTISGHLSDIKRHLRSYLKKNHPEIVEHVFKGD